ncbi:MAG TPA: hypothetical protein VF596_05165 [Pyrinomonadaceae bacterium]|jgi:hypothetical protein
MAKVIFKVYSEEVRKVSIVKFLKYDVHLPLEETNLKQLHDALNERRIVSFKVETIERAKWIALGVIELGLICEISDND